MLQDRKQTVVKVAPPRIASLDQAIKPGGPLAGWRLAHLHAVLAGAGGVAIDDASAHAKFPRPQILLYAPASGLDGSHSPYTLNRLGLLHFLSGR